MPTLLARQRLVYLRVTQEEADHLIRFTNKHRAISFDPNTGTLAVLGDESWELERLKTFRKRHTASRPKRLKAKRVKKSKNKVEERSAA